MRARRLAFAFLIPVMLALLVFFGTLYAYDPLSIFHLPWGREFTIAGNMRWQNAALIKHFDFDSIIIGNSHTENTSAREAGDLFGGAFMNLSMAGSSLYEQSFVLNRAFREKDIKTVFRLIHPNHDRARPGGYSADNWAYLYDANPLNDFDVYLNAFYLGCLRKWSSAPECVGTSFNRDMPTAWFEQSDYASRFGGLDKWVLHHDNWQISGFMHKTLPALASRPPVEQRPIASETAAAVRADINEFIVGLAREHPETRFICFFSPGSLLEKAVLAWDGRLEYYLFWVRETVMLSKDCGNIEIYGFDNEAFTQDIANYKDLDHYSKDINSLILTSIHAGANRLTPETVDAYIERVRSRTLSFDMLKLNATVREQLPPDYSD
jgi:hypothetical protein